jgi:hypothetical protein
VTVHPSHKDEENEPCQFNNPLAQGGLIRFYNLGLAHTGVNGQPSQDPTPSFPPAWSAPDVGGDGRTRQVPANRHRSGPRRCDGVPRFAVVQRVGDLVQQGGVGGEQGDDLALQRVVQGRVVGRGRHGLDGGDHRGAGGRAAQQAPECFALGKGGGDGGFADFLRAAIQNGGQ